MAPDVPVTDRYHDEQQLVTRNGRGWDLAPFSLSAAWIGRDERSIKGFDWVTRSRVWSRLVVDEIQPWTHPSLGRHQHRVASRQRVHSKS